MRVEARIVEAEDDKPRKIDFHFIVASNLRSITIMESTHRSLEVEWRGSKGRNFRLKWLDEEVERSWVLTS